MTFQDDLAFKIVARALLWILATSFSVSMSQAQAIWDETNEKSPGEAYDATNGSAWGGADKTGWDMGKIPSGVDESDAWHGLTAKEGKLSVCLPQEQEFESRLSQIQTSIQRCEAKLYAQRNDVQTTHEILKSLYLSTNGDNWTYNDGWNIDVVPSSMEDFNDWAGLKVSGGKLVRMALGRNNLYGSLPAELGKMSDLQALFLSDNNLAGSIPPEFGNLLNLDSLGLASSNLTGNIPPELGNLSNLKWLSLSENNFTGNIPPELGNLSNLKWLWMQKVGLSGKIPAELGKLSNLESIVLSGNYGITGEIPVELSNLSNLEKLYLYENNLTGRIPAGLGNLFNLNLLSLFGNRLTGEIPVELGNLSSLEGLYLYKNNLTGGIPSELGRLSGLRTLYLSQNQLTGEIPSELGNLSNLEGLYLFKNQLTGRIPVELGNLPNLRYLYLSYNDLTGRIPTELGNLLSIEYLSLRFNQLTSTIPTELGSLSILKSLQLENNQLTGTIPTELGNLSLLEVLHLNANQLGGEVPRSFLQLKNLKSLGIPRDVCAPRDGELRTWLNNFQGLNVSICSPVFTEQDSMPIEFTLYPNYPNPFRNSTNLTFDLPYPAQIAIEVFDITGKRVSKKLSANFPAGKEHEIHFSGLGLPSGTYLYRLTATTSESTFTRIGQFIRIQ